MNILVISNLYPPQVIGGYERSIADFAHQLQQRGHQVLVLTSDMPDYTTHTPQVSSVAVDRCLLLGGKWRQGQNPEWLPIDQLEAVDQQNLQVLAPKVSAFQPDICLAGNLDFFNVSIVNFLLDQQIPVVHYVMNAHPGYPAEISPHAPHHRYLTCSNWIAETLRQTGYPAKTAVTLYPGAAVEAFYQANLPPRDRLRIAYASLVMPYKGADVLIEALSLLNALGIDFTATIAGGTLFPQFVESLKAFVVSEGMDDRVTFPGVLSRQDLSQLYQTHNVLVFPSRFEEPFGISQVEAMAAGLTLITSGTGGAKEIIEHGKDGLLFESENPLALADALTHLLKYPDAWAAIAQAGQQTAMTQFNHTRAVEQLEAVLWNLVQTR